MGWIKVGEINIYSISNDISTLSNAFFEFMMSLINPFFGLIFVGFTITMIVYIIYAVNTQIEHAGD